MIYSKFADVGDGAIPCRGCGEEISIEAAEEYLKQKSEEWVTVKPTCTVSHCLKNPKIKWDHSRKRKLDKDFKNKEKLAKKIKVMRKRKRELDNANDGETT